MPHHARSEEEHGETLAAPLRVPDHAIATVSPNYHSRLLNEEKKLPVWLLGFSNPLVGPPHSSHHIFSIIDFKQLNNRAN